ncbi:uncharacterized protein LOC123895936 [Trifolium pratense]|uniref:uncharacterized protein LOC123895936 n=1 Tax=Trifolium pratense TaxID=57577 RepID=UPI001E6927C0|nr:uncharacterized protein LOC123895936 [Trifolium pratense]
MENWQDQHDALKGEVAQLTGKLDKALELLANMSQPAQPAVLEATEPATLTSQGGSVWPFLGLPAGYTPREYIPTQQVPQNAQTPQNRVEGSNTHPTRVPQIKPVFVSQQENLDDPRNAYQGPNLLGDVPKVISKVPRLEEAHQKFKAIEDRLSMMEGGGDPLDLANMCLVPDLVLPPKFKVPDFERYKGLSCPKNHLIMYSRKMASFASDDKLMMHCFQDSLTGASLNWYMQLEGNRILSWRDLANAFIKQYQYNIDMAPDRTQLQNMSQKEGESFRVYAQRWRELAAQVRPPLLEVELVDIFTNTLQGAYFERMVGSVSSSFSDLVKIGERIENGIKSGKIQATVGSQCTSKEPANSFTKKKDEETNAVTPKRRVFDLIPMSYGQLIPYLVHNGMVIPRALKPMTPPFPAWYDDKAKCEFHMGAEGHSIDNCIAFKHLVQELIDGKVLTFKDGKPNVKDSPLPEAV